MCLGYAVVASILIHGARKGRPDLLMPWIILTVISFIFDWILIIGYMVYAVHAAWVSGLFLFAMGCYSFIVVFLQEAASVEHGRRCNWQSLKPHQGENISSVLE